MIDYAEWVSQAKARLDEIDQERNHLLAILENAQALTSVAHVPVIRHSSDSVTQVIRLRRRTPATGSVMDTTRAAVAKILESYGEPLETRDLVPLVKDEGVAIGGKDDVATLSARLSNSGEQFKLYRGVGWWFADRALPGASKDIEEAEGQSSTAKPSASHQETEGGESNTAALD